ncbi:MAG TPA: hypothetical protein VHS31_05170, partial [Tepidisphaeraceae bacterium]|nr:hypothetical protein [Tepidisphaeraceae bacterium]
MLFENSTLIASCTMVHEFARSTKIVSTSLKHIESETPASGTIHLILSVPASQAEMPRYRNLLNFEMERFVR